MTGGLASAVFGETLWRHLCLFNCGNELPWKRSRNRASPVTHSSEDPPRRGAEKTTPAGSPPMNAYHKSVNVLHYFREGDNLYKITFFGGS